MESNDVDPQDNYSNPESVNISLNEYKVPIIEFQSLLNEQKKSLENTQLTLLELQSDIERKNSQSRSIIVIFLLVCITATITGTFVYIFSDISTVNSEDGRELITLMWTSQVGLIGSAIGYYFGRSERGDKKILTPKKNGNN